MIIPNYRIICWVSLIVLILGVSSVIPAGWVFAGSLAAFTVALALLDVLLGFKRRGDITIDLPDVVKLARGRLGAVELRLTNTAEHVRKFSLGLALPWGITSEQRELALEVQGNYTARLEWPCKSAKRGNYMISGCFFGMPSPLGFWTIRHVVPCSSEIRVYPNVSAEKKKMSALFLKQQRFGFTAQRQMGKGQEFEHLRNYLPNDCYEDIYWKATAKRRFPVTKVYQVERTQEVYVVLDSSRLSERRHPTLNPAEADNTILESYVTATLLLAMAAERQGDLFGFIGHSNKVQRFLRAKNGPVHINACREAIYTIEPQTVTPDYSELFTFIAARLRKRALLLFLTNLDDHVLGEFYSRNIHMLAKKHLVVAAMMRPRASQQLFAEPDAANKADLYRKLAGHMMWSDLRELEKQLHRKGVNLLLMDHPVMFSQLINHYLSIKQRQIL